MSGRRPYASDANDTTVLFRAPPYSGAFTAYTGWTDQRITRGIERCPSDFEVTLTAKGPQGIPQVNIATGWECQVYLGNDLVLTGYIDRYAPSLSVAEHTITIQGRSKCGDLVDCAAEFSTFQMNGANVLSLAQLLAQPYGITVKAIGDIGNTTIPQFGITLGESPFDLIERVARYAAVLVYDDTDGNLILTRAGSQQMASGFSQGQNIQAASAIFTMDQRFSRVDVALQTTDTLFTSPDQDGGSSAQAFADDLVTGASATDPNVPRFRPMILISEMNDLYYAVAQQRAVWEVARRAGRSSMVRMTVDSWRDSSGALWLVNALAPVDVPALGINKQNWLITEVTFRRALDGGTLADITMMPPAAVLPEPILLQTGAPEVAQALLYGNSSGASKNTTSTASAVQAAIQRQNGGAGL